MQQLQSRVELLNMALQASREEMGMLREEAITMHHQLGDLAADDPIRKLAAGHARYAVGMRPGFLARIFSRFRG